MNKGEIEKKYLFALYNKIALTNVISYLKANKKNSKLDHEISEENFIEQFVLNKNWADLVDKLNKQNKEERWENNKFAQVIAKYLKLMCDFYSHSEDYIQNDKEGNIIESYQLNKDNLEIFETKYNYLFKKIIRTINFNLVNNFNLWEKRLFFITFFLTKNEINDLKVEIKKYFSQDLKNILTVLENYSFHTKLAFKPLQNNFQQSIHQKLLNYLKHLTINYHPKITFINLAINLLNIKMKKYFIQFRHEKGNDKFFGKFILKNEDNQEIKSGLLSYASLKILLSIKNLEKIADVLTNIEIFKDENINNQQIVVQAPTYQGFLKRYHSDSKIEYRHLLKTLNRTNRIIHSPNQDDIKTYQLHQNHFEELFQALNLSDLSFLKNQRLIEKLKKMRIEIPQAQNDAKTLANNIKNYIINQINTEELWQKLITRDKKPLAKAPNRKSKIYLHPHLINEYLTKNQIEQINYAELFNLSKPEELSSAQKDKQNFAFQYLYPLLGFYENHFAYLRWQKPVSIDDSFLNINQNEWISKKQLQELFANRIPQNKNQIIIHYYDSKIVESEIKIFNFYPENIHYTINSKLFWEFKKLLKINSLNQKSWKEILKQQSLYLNEELKFIQKVFEWDTISEKNDYQAIRNQILNRNLNEFGSIKNLWKIINPEAKIPRIAKTQNFQKSDSEGEINQKIANFHEEIVQ